MKRLAWIGTAALVAAMGCGDGGGGSGATGGMGGDGGSGGIVPRDYSARIVRTTYGVPHVTADDWGSLGYGDGYAYAQDNFCVLMREVVRSNGQTARYFGEDGGSVNQDYLYTWYNTDEAAQTEFLDRLSPNFQEVITGYAAGLNRYLDETGVDELPEGPEGCRGSDWVRPLTAVDLAKVYRKLLVRAGLGQINALIVAASDAAPTESLASLSSPVLIESTPLNLDALNFPEPVAFGSNAYGIGAEGSQTESGLLLGNPHFPWSGSLRWYVHHLTLPGEYDVMGAALQGLPLVAIGFNTNLAWSHTVSTAQRFSFFEVELTDDDPFKYLVDGEERDIEASPTTIEILLEDGSIEEQTKSIYTTEYGPVVNLEALNPLVGGWPTVTNTLFTIRDANIDNVRAVDQFVKLGQSNSIDELEVALEDIGLPWVNTIAADRAGTGFYADVSTVPNISKEKLEDCADNLFSQTITTSGVATLNGSRSECNWDTDADGPEGLLGYDNLPKLRTSADVPYVSNSNDSYWLSSPDSLLENFSPLMGRNGFEPPEQIQQSLRTRQGFIQAEERLAGSDGLGAPGFNIDLLRDIMFGNRNIAGELTRNDVVDICNGVADWTAGTCGDDELPYTTNPDEAEEACTVLENWDGLFNNDSVGAALWRNVWFRMSGAPNLWEIPFNAADPIGTPSVLNIGDPAVVEAVRCALGGGTDFLVDAGIPLDRPWGEVQFRWNGDRTEQIPIHGGSGGFMWSVISSGFVEGEGYSNISTGNSYIQTVTWDETECPDAFAVLTYSQSTNPDSPHYSDMTELYSGKGWNDMPYCEADIEAAKISEIEISTQD